jgi:hypothetical protein
MSAPAHDGATVEAVAGCLADADRVWRRHGTAGARRQLVQRALELAGEATDWDVELLVDLLTKATAKRPAGTERPALGIARAGWESS